MSTVLSVRDAHKTYGQTKALNGADLELHKGEWLALLGPNGAGKTTLIRAIAGRVRLDQGTIELLDQRLDPTATGSAGNNAARDRLGVVPQEIALYPQLTAEENLRAFGSLHGVSGSTLNDRVKWALEWTGLKDRANSQSKTFSGGMKRRLNIACGVLHRPDVVLLDEPTVGVDPQSRERIWDMLSQLRDEGASLVITTHQLDEAQTICDRIVIIDHGRSIANGTLEQLVNQTIGRCRQVTLAFEHALEGAAPMGGERSDDGRYAMYRINDVVCDLPPLLACAAASNRRIIDVKIESPTLQAVFIHLTGRELRE